MPIDNQVCDKVRDQVLITTRTECDEQDSGQVYTQIENELLSRILNEIIICIISTPNNHNKAI